MVPSTVNPTSQEVHLSHIRRLALSLVVALSLAAPAVAADNVRSIKLTDDIDPAAVLAVIGGMTSKVPVTELDVEINSHGGLVDSGTSIAALFQFLEAHGVKVKCLVTGQASSAAFVILESCSERYAVSKATLMMHEPFIIHVQENGTTSAITMKVLRAMLEDLEANSKAFSDIIAPRLGLTPKQYHDRLDAGGMEGWRMTAPEALANHAIDAIKETI